MAQYINTNIASLNAQRNLSASQSSLSTSLQRLSSGLRINSAKDDAAGLSISERFTSQIRGANQAARNANDGISLAQTAEGDLSQVGDSLQRMRELAVQASNGTNSASDRKALDSEFQQLSSEIDRLAQNSNFNGVSLLDGTFQSQSFQIGANATSTDSLQIGAIKSTRTSSLGQFNGVNSTDIGAINAGAATGSLTVALTGAGATSKVMTNVASDAKAIAAAMNNSGISGLTATADANVQTGTTAGAATASGTASFTLNGTNISVNVVQGNTGSSKANALAAINAQSANTGVVASDTGNGLKLTAADGRNIAFSAITPGTATAASYSDLGLGNVDDTGETFASTVKATYVAPDTGAPTTVTVAHAGVNANATKIMNVGQTGTAVSATDLTTSENASNAIKTLDAALSQVNGSRANLGAVQNRFASVVSSLQSRAENLSASRSRIQDADFATETANLTRGQILQQAGTAMLAQANSLPNGVLSLLRG